jgi:hypothetical protein
LRCAIPFGARSWSYSLPSPPLFRTCSRPSDCDMRPLVPVSAQPLSKGVHRTYFSPRLFLFEALVRLLGVCIFSTAVAGMYALRGYYSSSRCRRYPRGRRRCGCGGCPHPRYGGDDADHWRMCAPRWLLRPCPTAVASTICVRSLCPTWHRLCSTDKFGIGCRGTRATQLAMRRPGRKYFGTFFDSSLILLPFCISFFLVFGGRFLGRLCGDWCGVSGLFREAAFSFTSASLLFAHSGRAFRWFLFSSPFFLSHLFHCVALFPFWEALFDLFFLVFLVTCPGIRFRLGPLGRPLRLYSLRRPLRRRLPFPE